MSVRLRATLGAIAVLSIAGVLSALRGIGPHPHVVTPPVAVAANQQAAEAAFAAALRIVDGVPVEVCQEDRHQRACVEPMSRPEHAERGIAAFGVAYAASAPLIAVLGREAGGEWGFWFGTRSFVYQLLELPGEMQVCAADGLDLHAEPSAGAAVSGRLAHLSPVTAEEFVLTEPGELPADGVGERSGRGWYRLSAPLEGWAPASALTNTTVDATLRLPPCATRDALVDRRP
jgi:hypothetical protein